MSSNTYTRSGFFDRPVKIETHARGLKSKVDRFYPPPETVSTSFKPSPFAVSHRSTVWDGGFQMKELRRKVTKAVSSRTTGVKKTPWLNDNANFSSGLNFSTRSMLLSFRIRERPAAQPGSDELLHWRWV